MTASYPNVFTKICIQSSTIGREYLIITFFCLKKSENNMALLNDNYCEPIRVNEVSQAIKSLILDTPPGPDHIFMGTLHKCR